MTLKAAFKRIFRNPVVWIPFILFFAFLAYEEYRYCFLFSSYQNSTSVGGLFESLAFTLELCPYIFIFFLFISYEACRAIRKQGLAEVLDTKPGARIKLYVAHLLVLSLFVLLIYLLFLIFNLCACHIYLEKFTTDAPEVQLYISFCLFIYVALLSLCAIVLGTVFSACFKRVGAYLSMLLTVALIIASSFEGVAGVFALVAGNRLYKIIDIFNILPAGTNRRVVFQTAFSILPDRIFTPCLLICLALLCLFIYLYRNKKSFSGTVLKLAALALCIFFSVELLLPQSKITYIQDHPNSAYIEDVLSVRNNEFVPADFRVLQYDMALQIKRELKAEVSVTIDDTSEKPLNFTLWNAYYITAITDENGMPLDFVRTDNYFTVQNRAGNRVLRIAYRGHSNHFFSNRQATYLAGYFPYYPMPGKCPVSNPVFSTAFNNNFLPYDTEFRLTVDTSQKVFSNLDRTAGNTFSGKAASVTVMTGFLDEVEINGVKLIYPYTEPTNMFRSADFPQTRANTSGYQLAETAVALMLEHGAVPEGGCVVINPQLNQQPAEIFLTCGDTYYLNNLLSFANEEQAVESINYLDSLGAVFYSTNE